MDERTSKGEVIVQAHCVPEEIEQWRLAEGMGIFWRGDLERQKASLVTIAGQPEGNVLVARADDGTIVGFVTILAPDPSTRWGKEAIPGLLELGGVEVAREWRGAGLARRLLAAAFGDGEYDTCIVFVTAYSWCWDLEGMDLSIASYRKMLHTVFAPFGFEPYVTDEPNVRYYSGNVLAARVGPRVSLKLFRQFQELLIQDEERPDYLRW